MRCAWIMAVLLVLGLIVLPVAGQPAPGEAGIVGNGMGEVKKAADLLRMTVGMQVEGRDLKDALAKLQARKDALKPALAKLGADEGSIDFGGAAVLDSAADPRRRHGAAGALAPRRHHGSGDATRRQARLRGHHDQGGLAAEGRHRG